MSNSAMRSRQKYLMRKVRLERVEKRIGGNLSSCLSSAETNLISIHEDTSSIPVLAQWAKDPVLLPAVWIWRCCGPGIGWQL